jgi:hypothetical protein
MLILHFIGLAMGLGTSFAFMFLGMAAAKMEKPDALKFVMNTFILSRMGHIGLTLLVVSGLYLMTPYWSVLTQMPLLMGKLALVIILLTIVGINTSYIVKAKKGEAQTYLPKVKPLGRIALITALLIVIAAVAVFH